jgi:serine/threonine-protein kinase
VSDSPVWSPDGEWVYFGSSAESANWQAYRKRLRGGTPPVALGHPPDGTDLAVLDCSGDGRWLLVSPAVSAASALWLGLLEGDTVEWSEWLDTPASEPFARFSRDSRWIAFQSDASGQFEIYVAPLEGGPTKGQWMVSVNGGTDPAWSADGSRLYYRNLFGSLMEAPIRIVGETIEAGTPVQVLELHPPDVGYLRNVYDPHPQGNAIVAFVETGGHSPAIRVRTGWRRW